MNNIRVVVLVVSVLGINLLYTDTKKKKTQNNSSNNKNKELGSTADI